MNKKIIQKRIRAYYRRLWFRENKANIFLIAFILIGILTTLSLINLTVQRKEAQTECYMWIEKGLIREQWQVEHCQKLI
jgi:hypothetical protein